ncbi:MAG: AAA family ATPase, partial [Burkholderiales bacterium]|nr:AAA family ATPase [Burkholderiales bacterium]
MYQLREQLDDGSSNEPLEIVIGVGMVSWIINGRKIQYPLITKTVEIILDEKTHALEIFPKSTEPILEIAHFEEGKIRGIHDLENEFNKFYQENANLSPFEPETFELILRYGVTFLDHSGSYLPEIASNDSSNRNIPKPEEKLIITDTWVIFARPKTTNVLINDLEQFKIKLSESDMLIDGSVGALVTDLSEVAEKPEMPAFRGLSMVDSYSNSNQKAKELYFPLPFNDEQVRIVQRLEYLNGVVVQGPPGTGKTHTIANVICHYLALGKKILVTSMREHALSVLQEKIPELIRPLTISLLSNERTSMKQFEDSIAKIANEIQIIDCNSFTKEIEYYEHEIDILHSSLKNIDSRINQLAQMHMENIIIDGTEISPVDAAKELMNSSIEIAWIPDKISIDDKYMPRFTDDCIDALGQAKIDVGDNIYYIGTHDLINKLQELPNSNNMVQLHNDLVYINGIRLKINNGSIPMLANNSDECIKDAEILLENVKKLIEQCKFILQNNESWINKFTNYIHDCYAYNNFAILETLKLFRQELESLENRKLEFITLPVNISTDFLINNNLEYAVVKLSQGKKPFGIKGIVGKQKEKELLAQVLIASNKPRTAEDWLHVVNYLKFLKEIKALCSRWNALASELHLPTIS